MQEDFAWMKAELNAIYDAAVEKKSASIQAEAILALAQVMATEKLVEAASDVHEMALDVVKHPV